jgi:acyl carrier protein
MDDTSRRLVTCFQTAFPDLPETQIQSAKQSDVKDWDSVAAITLVNVIEDEFAIEMDLDKLADLDSFEKIAAYLKKEHPLSCRR